MATAPVATRPPVGGAPGRELIVPLALVAVVVIMVIPLPPLVLDLLLASNASVECFPVITGAREWDDLLTDFVVAMLDGELFTDDECADLIVGDRSQGKAMQLRRKRRDGAEVKDHDGIPVRSVTTPIWWL